MTESSYAGVTETHSGFTAQIGRRGRVYYLGSFETAQIAAHHADRAMLLTIAYTKSHRRSRLNTPAFDHSDLNTLTEWEQRMMDDLRERFPNDEKRYKKEFKTAYVMEMHADRLRRFFLARKSYRDMEDEMMGDFKNTLESFVARTLEDTTRIEYLTKTMLGLQEEVARLKGTKPFTAADFKPINPKPAPAPADPTDVNPLLPATGSEVASPESGGTNTGRFLAPVVMPSGVTPPNDSPAGEEAPESADNTAFVKE